MRTMDRADIADAKMEWIAARLSEGAFGDQGLALARVAGGEAPELLLRVSRVEPPERIGSLRELEREQASRGASFLGMLPDQVSEDLETPDSIDACLRVAIHLASIRAANLEAVAETMPEYPLAFTGQKLPEEPTAVVPPGWKLELDAHGITAALDFFDREEADAGTALHVARMPAFAEMMRHRRGLGYVPEPLIDAEGLAWCLQRAASRDPVDELWKWLHPHNLFDLADLFAHRRDYRRLLDRVVAGDGLARAVLGRMAPYAPPGFVFEDVLTFAVGWGIRGWATAATGGLNIEHTKDDFPAMVPTLVHETFHRLQTKLSLADPTNESPGFERITSFPLPREADRRLYQALCYVMLEGSATYVARQHEAGTHDEDVISGFEILSRVSSIERSDDRDTFDELLNEGLRSNGPFYGLGAALSDTIVSHDGPQGLGACLARGAPRFVARALELDARETLAPPAPLVEHIARLRDAVSRHVGDRQGPR